MSHTANDTLLLEEPVGRQPLTPVKPAVPDLSEDLARIIRRALRNPQSQTPLSQALRAAVARVTPNLPATASQDDALRVRQVARQMSALLAQRAAPHQCSPHQETVRY
jgi:hypothetical protein